MSKHGSETSATQFLGQQQISFGRHPYDYVDCGGSAESAKQLGVDEHAVIKTLMMKDKHKKPLIVLMHGDRKVSTKNLARQIARKEIEPCKPDEAQKHTGYRDGGTSPFGTRKDLPVFLEASVLDLPLIYINGGRRGFLVSLSPQSLVSLINAQPVQCALTA